MTYDIEIEIEELRAELRNACDAGERRQIEIELDVAQAELAAAVALQNETVDREPPY
ncbi:hypothetical protein SAMN05216228_10464 [Rhizobium tibeticum]|uniref:Uncharacterized protein n=1 Tax=Rhizobium tibeticum TaxID=501024 RepID=A0A1H8VRK5_9HYPH|nr:hypothetical protein [Rhizobium tibeticum]SEI19528.1 hypothetical protein RTCCBAU85039_6179 [Rhizobium tibeticum]SEP17578.1 hypothetical protein SAMN05216228_10464 [Rhizobium tibeticum]